jgi:methyltransferase (TIGR00027 family)
MTEKNRISITAQGIALIRAMEYEKPEPEMICSDPLARKFIDPWFFAVMRLPARLAERRSPGVMGFMTARCRYLDDCVGERFAGGIRQLVILGAGLDSRAYRIGALQDRARVFEVDLPATQKAKIERVKRVLGGMPEKVAYVPVESTPKAWAN